ncbi:MAG: hypothetical protein NTW74_07195 [Acidobacteria bacterium]|nr:hypothetical protein [Acidobacteriota bacterium]
MANPFKALLRAVQGSDDSDSSLRPSRPAPRTEAPPATKPTEFAPPQLRSSSALQQFVRSLDTNRDLRLLDLGGANAANIQFMTQLGTRLYSEDFFATLEDCFGDGDYYENQRDPARVDSFLIQTFSEQRGPFDGALVWDCLQFLRPSLLDKTIDHLHRILEPGAHLLAYFYADERAQTIPQYDFKINDEHSIYVAQKAEMPPGQAFSNRNIERLFEDFASTKFFLSRDNMREVLVRR